MSRPLSDLIQRTALKVRNAKLNWIFKQPEIKIYVRALERRTRKAVLERNSRSQKIVRSKDESERTLQRTTPQDPIMAAPPSYSLLSPAPWKHPSELAMVRDWFYPDHVPGGVFNFLSPSQVDHRQDAINLVSLWRFREPRLTHALVSTATLTDAILHDQPGKRDHFSSLALRSIYAMAFCRFVNALVDRDVRKSVTVTIAKDLIPAGPVVRPEPHRGASSMYANALELGLPESFVELRHQAIHEEMPSLEVLRARTGEALEWLWDRWWKYNVKGTAEPALSQWMEKIGKWKTNEFEAGAGEKDVRLEPSTLCAKCRQGKRSEPEDGREDDVDSAEGEDENSSNTNRQKQQKLDTEGENKGSSTQQPQKWVMEFY